MDAEIQKRWAGPEQAVSLLKRKIRPTWLWAFQATFFSGLLIHLYRMANYIMVDDTPYSVSYTHLTLPTTIRV